MDSNTIKYMIFTLNKQLINNIDTIQNSDLVVKLLKKYATRK